MKQYLLSKGGNGTFLIEWDMEQGELTITHNGHEVSKVDGQTMKTGIVGVDEVVWSGQQMQIMRHVHEYFEKEFPTTDLKAEYLKADEWCVGKGRKTKNAQAFMSNWLKRSKGGNQSRGGVIY